MAGLLWLGVNFELGKSDWAAWVQAVGSIAAIVGAWLIGKSQSKAAFLHALRLKESERYDRVRAVFPIAERAHALITALDGEQYDHYYKVRYSDASFRVCIKAIEAIPLHELGNFGLVQGYMEMQQALAAAAHAAAKRLELGNDLAARFAERASDSHVADARHKAEMALELIKSNQYRRSVE
ncbi:hypothetical protein [Variovorax atrisoli]|uniref:hypothetical protein n=1 Tax=Variovorax atrisoli TaxID=3394203 RepID=UPI0033958292